jgi:HNH endonuclease
MFRSFELSALPLRLREKIYVEPNTGCWLWTGALRARGYGQIRRSGKGYIAHRIIYEFFNGPVATGFDVHHHCRTSCCVNPAHLEVLPHAEHSRLQIKVPKAHCIRGHPFNEANTYYKNGRRHCRTCRALRTKSLWPPGKYPNSIGMINAAKTHCPRGHPYDETNTIFRAGSRECRICVNEQKRRSYHRRKRG